jgi:hypothetical protein
MRCGQNSPFGWNDIMDGAVPSHCSGCGLRGNWWEPTLANYRSSAALLATFVVLLPVHAVVQSKGEHLGGGARAEIPVTYFQELPIVAGLTVGCATLGSLIWFFLPLMIFDSRCWQSAAHLHYASYPMIRALAFGSGLSLAAHSALWLVQPKAAFLWMLLALLLSVGASVTTVFEEFEHQESARPTDRERPPPIGRDVSNGSIARCQECDGQGVQWLLLGNGTGLVRISCSSCHGRGRTD